MTRARRAAVAEPEVEAKPEVNPDLALSITFTAEGFKTEGVTSSGERIPSQTDEEGVEFPFDPGEYVAAERVEQDGEVLITWLVTNFGRKIGIDPWGWMHVVMGPPLDYVVGRVPKADEAP